MRPTNVQAAAATAIVVSTSSAHHDATTRAIVELDASDLVAMPDVRSAVTQAVNRLAKVRAAHDLSVATPVVPLDDTALRSAADAIGRAHRRTSQSAVVYLAQKAPHSDYGRNTFANLKRSLALLHVNYLCEYPADVLVFHNGDMDDADLDELRRATGETMQRCASREKAAPLRLSLHTLAPGSVWWRVPPDVPGLSDFNASHAWHPHFGVGYRHMIRWYARLLFYYMNGLGYRYVMRMDEESYIASRVGYDMFARMASRGYRYAYRMFVREPNRQGFAAATRVYLSESAPNMQPAFLFEECNPPSLAGVRDPFGVGVVDPAAWTPGTMGWSGAGYYNNFFVADVSLFLEPRVAEYLRFLDDTGGFYLFRWNDLIAQSMVVQLFVTREQLHQFTEWTYEHVTLLAGGKCVFGGIVTGTKDANANFMLDVRCSDYGDDVLPMVLPGGSLGCICADRYFV